jgi:hypothetical protein
MREYSYDENEIELPAVAEIDVHEVVDIELTIQQWQAVQLEAALAVDRHDVDPELALKNVIHDAVDIEPRVLVDGEPVQPENIREESEE